jgi:hypothetical protein
LTAVGGSHHRASYDRVVSAITAAGSGRSVQGAGYIKVSCSNPAHDDRNPSCKVSYDSVAKKTSVHCFGCEDDEAVLQGAGLTWADLYDEPRRARTEQRSTNGFVELGTRQAPRKKDKPAPQPSTKKAPKKADDLQLQKVCDYLYVNAQGERVGKVLRYNLLDTSGAPVDKTFRQLRFDPERRRWVKEGFEALLYRLPDVDAAIKAGQPVYLVEGEKDADTAVDLGVTGTTNAGGAGSFTSEHAEQLRGAHVVAVVDRDLPGYRRALAVRDLLTDSATPIARSYRVVEPAIGKDLTDHRTAGKALADLIDIDPAAKAVALTPVEAGKAVKKGKLPVARNMLEQAREWLDLVVDADERARLARELDTFEAAELPTEMGDQLPPDELSQKRQQRQQATPADAEEAGAPEPHWPIHVTGGVWAYSTGEDGDGYDLPRGVYKLEGSGWRQLAPLPHVLERLTRRDGQGRRTGISYRLSMHRLAAPEDVVICSDPEIKDGSWADQLDVTLSADDKVVKAVATAIRQYAREHAQVREITPRWTSDGQLELPPVDVLGGGYGQVHGPEDTARTTWKKIAQVVHRNPKVALAAGTAVAGLFVRPLLPVHRSFWLQLVGRGQAGKTTTLRLCASLFGGYSDILETFDASGKGLTYRLGEMGCLPIFLDEIGSGEIKGADVRERTILSIGEGASRRVATRTQGTRSSAPWHSTIICSGNDSLLDGIANEAVYARVVELPTPITESADDSDALDELLSPEQPVYGWPLHWLRQDINLERVRSGITTALAALPVPEGGGVPRTAGKNLALALAGAAELDRAIGSGTAIQDAALAKARDILNQLIDELSERGMTPAERVISAVTQALTSRPAAFPTRYQYAEAMTDSGDGFRRATLPRDVEGFLITEDVDLDGDIAILHDKLDPITAAAGLTDPRTGLRELAEARVLVRSGEAGGKLQRRIRVLPGSKQRPSCYIFRLDPEILATLPTTASRPTGDSNDKDPTSPDATETPPPPSPASPPVPGSDQNTGDTPAQALTRTDDPMLPTFDALVPGVPGSADHVAQETEGWGKETQKGMWLEDGPAGPIWSARDGKTGRCRLPDCHDISRHYDRLGWIHWTCATKHPEQARNAPTPPVSAPDHQPAPPQQTAAPAEPTPPPATPTVVQDHVPLTGPIPPRPTGYRAACVVMDPSGIYLPDGIRYRGVPIQDAADILEAGEKLRIGHPGGPGQVILTDSMCVELGLVAQADPGLAGDDAREQIRDRLGELGEAFLARAHHTGWEIPKLRVENRARRGDRVFDIVLAPYEHLWTRGRDDAHPLGALDENLTEEQYAAESARIMGYLAGLLGAPWRANARQVGWDLFDRVQRGRRRRKGHVLTQPARLPQLTGGVKADDLVPQLTWSRWTPKSPATDDERAILANARYAVHLDRMAAWLGSAKASTFGYLTEEQPEMLHHDGADAVAALLQRPEAIPAGLMRVRVPPADNRAIPPLHASQSPTEPRWLWLPSPLVAQLLYDDDPTANMVGWGCRVEDLVSSGTEGGEARQAEAYTFPKQGRLLDDTWYETLRDARYTADHDGDKVATKLIKHIYSAFLQTAQNTSAAVLNGPRAWQHQATMLATVKANHYARQWQLIRQGIHNGLLVASLQIDEVVVLVSDPDAAALGRMDGKVGQYQIKKNTDGSPQILELTDDHRELLASGKPAHQLAGHDQDGEQQ